MKHDLGYFEGFNFRKCPPAPMVDGSGVIFARKI